MAFFLAFTFCYFQAFSQEKEEEDLSVFWKWLRWNNPGSLITDHMISQADYYYDRRDKKISRLKTREDWITRQVEVKNILKELIGSFPEETDLNPRVTGVIRKDGYRIEKVIYESMPGFYVTGCLFIPDNPPQKPGADSSATGLRNSNGKYPAILNVIGHNQESFRAELYQIVYLNLVKKGFIVLAIDPIGQGEKVQFYDPEVKFSAVGYSVEEHSYAGNLCFLTGDSPAKYFTLDGIRGIDYLLSRDEVDPDRIGVTGFSGGGTVTSFVAALDDRVKVSVPCSWSTASRRLIETKGAQDAESLFVGSLPLGISFEDLVEVRAPKPTLMTFTSRDEYLSIQGAREAFAEAGKSYRAFGKPENLQFVEDDFKHWLTPKIREAIYAFFMKHLEVAGDPEEVEVDTLTEEELTVTPTGQISTYLGGETIFTINKKKAEELMRDIENSRKDINGHLEQVKESAREIAGVNMPDQEPVNPFFNGRYQREGYTVAKYAIPGEGDYVIPLLLFVPDNPGEKLPALVYLHSEGKAAEAVAGGEIEQLVKNGFVVVAPDVLGVGELKNTVARSYTEDYTAILLGRSTVGVQAGDILRTVSYIRQLNQVDAGRIGAIGIGELNIPLLHAAALDPTISRIAMFRPLISYRSVVMEYLYTIGLIKRENGGYWHPYDVDFQWGVAGALTAYDLPDLVASLVPRKVAIFGPLNHRLEAASQELTQEDMAFPRKAFESMNQEKNLMISLSEEQMLPVVNWLFE